MNEILSALTALLPPRRKLTPSGWISFDAVCCHQRGQRRDDRKRGGIILTDKSFTYHCFNCNFKAGWTPGKTFSSNTKQLFKWLGMDDLLIGRLSLVALKLKDEINVDVKPLDFDLEEKELPPNSRLITDWLNKELTDEQEKQLKDCIAYIIQRGLKFEWYDWYWSPEPGYKDRLLIPFYHEDKIVGWTGRKITEGKPKYLTEAQASYVFNLTKQPYNRKFVVVVEGQLDAIAIDGVAIMHNDPNKSQCARINSLGREVIVVPDRDRPGATMIKAALENNWSVSLPPWHENIKDVADAVKQYGRLYTLTSILHYKETNDLKIKLLKKKLEGTNV